MGIAEEKDFGNRVLYNVEKLRSSKVLLIGAGGLGCGIGVHLAAAGIGEITVCDYDTVSIRNLNRQFFYNPNDVGKDKAQIAAVKLSDFAPDCKIQSITRKVNHKNVDETVAGYDIVILACDNTKVRLYANSACVKQKIMLLDSGIAAGCGSVYLYIPEKTPCLSCFTKMGEESEDKRTVSAAAGVISGFAAMTALRTLSGSDDGNVGKLNIIDTVNGTVDRLPIQRKKNCKICGGDMNG